MEERDGKIFQPTQKKLDDARKKGEIVKSQDLSMSMAYLGFIFVFFLSIEHSLISVSNIFTSFISQPESFIDYPQGDILAFFFKTFWREILFALSPVFLTPMAIIGMYLISSKSLLFTPSKIKVKASRINPVEGLKNKFGKNGLFDFVKNFFKFTLYSAIFVLFLYIKIDILIALVGIHPVIFFSISWQLMFAFFSFVLGTSLSVSLADLLWQRHQHYQKNMMTHKELRDETKESEGDPHFAQKRRAKAHEITHSQAAANVKECDVVIVNPTHFAVALKWSRTPGSAPICTAKGKDEVALLMRDVAKSNNIPIFSDPPTARSLYATIPVGHVITIDLYKPVAKAIRYAQSIK